MKLFWVQQGFQNQLCPVMIFNPNQSFGNRTTNIAFAQGSQNLLGLTLTGPKKASKSTSLQNRLNKKKLLGDVANLVTCGHDDYDVLLKVLGTLGKCYVSSPVAKTLEIMTGTTVFGCLPGAHPYWTQKSFKTNNFT